MSDLLDLNASSRVAKQVQLVDVVCVGLEARAQHPLEEGDSLAWDTPDLRAVWDLDERRLFVIFPLTVNINKHRSDPVVRVADVAVAFRVDYMIREDASLAEADVEHFAGINAFMHVWPYFRAEVESLTAKLRLPPLVLPTVLTGFAQKHVRTFRLRDVNSLSAASAKPKRKRRKRK